MVGITELSVGNVELDSTVIISGVTEIVQHNSIW